MATYDRYDIDAEYEARRRRARAKRRAEIRKRKKRRFYIRVAIRLTIYIAILAGIITLAVIGIKRLVASLKDEKAAEANTPAITEQVSSFDPVVETEIIDAADTEVSDAGNEAKEVHVYSAEATDATVGLPEGVASQYGILIDLESSNIICQASPKERMFPASMTKIMTCLVAAEHVTDLDDTFVMTPEINYFSYKNDCSAVGFSDEEIVTVRDLFYGTILPSGADAAVGLATYVAGSQEAFVDMMNEKLIELGLSETTHFTNCVGLHDENHYSTCYDMAMILAAAMDNDLCREVMHAHIYTTSQTVQHPDGIEISNWFLRRIEDHVEGGEVYAAKTGFVNESGNCAASYGISAAGHEYICVTGDSTSSWKCIKDHVAIYDLVFDAAEDNANP